MEADKACQVIYPDEYSHFRLRACLCDSQDVAYVTQMADGQAHWRVKCFGCGRMGLASSVRHEAQVDWNKRQEVAP